MDKPAEKKRVPVDFTPNEIEQLDWLKNETKRTRGGVIKWAVDKAAKELGHVSPSRSD